MNCIGLSHRLIWRFTPVLCSFLLAVSPLVIARATAQDWPPQATAVLNRFLGAWETETWIRREGPPLREFQTKGQAVCQKILEGRYFEFRTWSIPSGQADLQIMTYDPTTGLYRQWLFDSDGYQHEAEGRWEPMTSTLTWKGRTADSVFIIEDRWLTPDRLEWSLKRTDADGRLLQTIKGVLTRRKKH